MTCKDKSFFLQLLKTEARKMLVLVSRAFPEDRWKQSPLASHRERELSLQVHLAATGIQVSPWPSRAGGRSLWPRKVVGQAYWG